MEPNGTAFEWTDQREEAALLVAEDRLSDEQIAEKCSIGRTTLHRWKLEPAFAGRVEEHRTLWREELKRRGIADRQNRVDALNDRWRRLQQVIDERGTDPTMEGVPGGKTGLLVRQQRALGSGEFMQVVEEFSVDTGMLKEIREHEKQAAQELGQWTEKQDLTSGGKPVVFKVLRGVSMDDLK